jgi:hypothetical protein
MLKITEQHISGFFFRKLLKIYRKRAIRSAEARPLNEYVLRQEEVEITVARFAVRAGNIVYADWFVVHTFCIYMYE